MVDADKATATDQPYTGFEKELAKEFVQAWAAVENPAFDSVNPHFKNKYASLSSIQAEIRKACAPYGLVYGWEEIHLDGAPYLKSYLLDKEGRYITLSTQKLIETSNLQQYGGVLTYTKRQLAQMDWGIVGEEDDDGVTAVPKPHKEQKKQPPKEEHHSRYELISQLKKQAIDLGVKEQSIREYLAATYKTPDGKAIPMKDYTDNQIHEVEHYMKNLVKSAAEVGLHE